MAALGISFLRDVMMQHVSKAYKESMKRTWRNIGYIKIYIGIVNAEAQKRATAQEERINAEKEDSKTLWIKGLSGIIKHIYEFCGASSAQLYKIGEEYKEIKRIYIFGSSVTSRCHIDSDIDICIDADVSDGMKIFEMQSKIGDACDWNCDIIMYSNLGSRLKETIQKEGVIIYEQPFGER